jgi:hypothetical protein
MNISVFRIVALAVTILGASMGTYGQGDKSKPAAPGGNGATATPAITATTAPLDLARAALAAQGGEKFKAIQNMVLRGSVDLYAPNSTQSIPGAFVIAYAGDKIRIEIDARPAISFRQIFDGQRSYSSLPNVELPPFGIYMLTKFDQPGYTVSAIPDKKKNRGFRISDANGNSIDFYIETATGRVLNFLIPYNGQIFGTEHKKFKEIEGVLVPSNFSMRMEMPQGAFFADFNAKDIKLNQALGDDVFAIP